MHIPSKRAAANGAADTIVVAKLNHGLIKDSSHILNKEVPSQVIQNNGSMHGPK